MQTTCGCGFFLFLNSTLFSSIWSHNMVCRADIAARYGFSFVEKSKPSPESVGAGRNDGAAERGRGCQGRASVNSRTFY